MDSGKRRPSGMEIDAEVARLREMKPRVRRRSMFGDDNHAQIDAQILILERRLSENEAYDALPEELVNEAYDVFEWMAGGTAEKPSEAWEPLLQGEVRDDRG